MAPFFNLKSKCVDDRGSLRAAAAYYVVMVCSSSSAVSKDFASYFSYALSCLRKEDLVLKHEQSEVLEFVFRGKDVFVWFPTGFGKSICYQALPYMFDHKLGRSNVDCKSVVLVVSPLVSLMVDQVTSLRSAGVGAAILRSAGFLSGGRLTDIKVVG